MWHTAFSPVKQGLRGEREAGRDYTATDRVDEVAVMVEGHCPEYQQSVDEVNTQSLIAAPMPLPAWLDAMTLAERIKARIEQLGLSQAEAARRIDISAQRLNHYTSGKRRPDRAMLIRIASALKTDAAALSGINDDMIEALEPILSRLFELEGLDSIRSAMIAAVAAEALRLQTSLRDEGDARMLARMAAQAAWQQRSEIEPD